MKNLKLQTALDSILKMLADPEKPGRLTPYFKEVFELDHTTARSQTSAEIMIVEDVVKDPFHIDTWNSMIDGLMFSSPIRHSARVEYYILAQMAKHVDITLKAPAAAAMFLLRHITKESTPDDVQNLINAQLGQPFESQSGYLIINPIVFWQIVEHALPADITPSIENKSFIDYIEKLINELMLHEVNHHINGHTIMQSKDYSPLKPELITQYQDHKFALGKFKASSPHDLANIIEDFGINQYLLHSMNWPIELPSLFASGVSTIDPAVEQGNHALSKQPSTDADFLENIDLSAQERIQSFTDSDIQIEDDDDEDESQENGGDGIGAGTTLDELAQALTSAVEANGSGDAHAASENQSQIEQEIAQSQLSGSLKDAESATGSQPGMQGADYHRTIDPGESAKTLPKLSLKLAKIHKMLTNTYHVNWTMPHQVLNNRLDLHRIEKDHQKSPINVWLDTSGSMDDDELSRLLTLIIANYVTSTKKTPIILHTVSYGEVEDPITLTSKNDIAKLKNVGLGSNGGTSFLEVLRDLEEGPHIIMSDFEWSSEDIVDNKANLINPNKNFLWINTSHEENFVDASSMSIIKKTRGAYICLTDYEY